MKLNGSLVMRTLPCALFAVASAFGAVKPGEDILLNGKLEADQADFPPYWQANPDQFKWHPTGGPDGLPYVSVCGERNPDVRMRQSGLNLVSNGLYRISLRVRTRGFSARSPSGLVVVNGGLWASTAGITELPEDTDGKWQSVSSEFRCFAASDGYTAMVCVFVQRGQLDVADFRLEAVDELAQKGTGGSKLLECLARPRLVPYPPVLTRIPSDDRRMNFRFFGELAGEDSDYEVVAVADGSQERVTVPLGRDIMRIPLPSGATNGQVIVGLVHRQSGRRIVRNRYNFGTVERLQKASRSVRRRLNNLSTEVLSAEIATAGTNHLEFALSRDGWVFVAVKGILAADFSARIDGSGVMTAGTPRHETFRRLAAGEHALDVAGCAAGSVVVREIAEILNYCPGVNGVVAENPPYDWAFQEKYVLPAVTTQLGGRIPEDRRDGFFRRGYAWFDNINLTGGKTDAMVSRLSACGGLVDAWRNGIACDEQTHNDMGAIDDYAQGFWAFDAVKRPQKPIYTWVGGKPTAQGVAQDFCAACVNVAHGTGKLLAEIYCRTRATEEGARQYLRTYVGETVSRYRAWYPGVMPHMGVVFGNFIQVPVLSLSHHPEVDYKRYLDLQMNFAANDPSCRDLGLVGYWGSYYADDEMHRWSFALMRHYVVEGRSDLLSAAYGFGYRPDHILNGDFRGTLAPWKATGAVRTDEHANFAAKSQGRWGGNGGVGDTFAVLVRGADGVATLSQTAKGLVPGRFYCLQFSTFDVKDVKANAHNPRRYGLRARLLEGAKVRSDLSWAHVDRRAKGRYANNNGVARVNLHHVVFEAKADSVDITFDNAEAETGEELGVNYVSINPYFVRE